MTLSACSLNMVSRSTAAPIPMVGTVLNNDITSTPPIVHSFDGNDFYINLALLREQTSPSRDSAICNKASEFVHPWPKDHCYGQAARSENTTAHTSARTSESNNSDDRQNEEESYGCFQEIMDEDSYVLRHYSISTASQDEAGYQPSVALSGEDAPATHENRDDQLIFELEL